MFDDYDDVVTISDLCKMLKVGKNEAYKLVNNNIIKSIRIGKIHKIPKQNVINYVLCSIEN